MTVRGIINIVCFCLIGGALYVSIHFLAKYKMRTKLQGEIISKKNKAIKEAAEKIVLLKRENRNLKTVIKETNLKLGKLSKEVSRRKRDAKDAQDNNRRQTGGISVP